MWARSNRSFLYSACPYGSFGAKDRWLDRSVADRLRALIPDAELRLIPDAGHFSPEDAPAAVARELLEFFAA
jgi:pimeloyl-ACP methyl ester carboxylesterase